VTTLADELLTLTVYLTDLAGNQGAEVSDNVSKDVLAPSGYTVSIDQNAYLNNANQHNLSFTFAGAESGTTYN
jgi:hypothetical protein